MPAPTSPGPFSPLVELAAELSAQWHDQTYRKGGWRADALALSDDEQLLPPVPVAAHVTSVAMTVARSGFDEVTIAAAFLHDVLEDEDRRGRRLSLEMLEAAVGRSVALLVDMVTETRFDASGRARTWRQRKEDYLARLTSAPSEVLAISLADKLHNLWSINQALEAGIDVFQASPGRKPLSADASQQAWFFEAIAGVASRTSDSRLDALRIQFRAERERFAHLTER